MTTPDREDLDDLLDLGIATAFGLSKRSGDPVTPLILAPGEIAETIADLPAELGRYTVEAVLAQGGMGTVARAHDRELGREVAVKFLRRSLSAKPALQRLFHEEARVMARLQHPGIVPVHDLGTTADGRLYYVMTLIHGQSLKEELANERSASETAEGRTRLLAVFARICETIAFAHSRGFAHGDLKPANVMLGEFGEVQVLDWGFARAAQGAHAPDGEQEGPRALGTPAYMAPEQARGSGAVDARTDVFGLGGMLCEILTGAPPYRGVSREDVFLRASRGWLDDAHARLAACDADPELIELARACLSAAPERRPENATAVAARVNEHLAAVERRARELTVEAAAARARAAEERKARRLWVALSSVVASVLLAGMAALLWYEQRESGLRHDADQRVHAAQRRLGELRQRAREATGDKASAWTEATAVAREAAELARAPHVAPALRDGVERLREEVEQEGRIQLRDAQVRELIDEIRPHHGEERSVARIEEEHRELFALFGVDVDTDPPDAVVAAVGESRLTQNLAAALHRWAHHRRAAQRDQAHWQRLLELADHLDRDPWRARLRQQCAARDAAVLRELAAAPGVAEQAGSSLGMLAECLDAAGARTEALHVYRVAHLQQPGDYAIAHDLAVLLEGEPAPPRAEIARLFTAAAALRPDHAHTLVDLGIALLENGELPAGRTVLDRAHAIAPNYPRAWIGLVAARSVAGDTAGALAAARELWRLQPGSPKAAMLLVHALARSGELAEARAVATAQVERAPESAAAAGMLGTLLAEAGALADAIAMLRRAVDLDPTGGAHYYDLGVALQRAGLTAEAEAAYRQAIERNPGFAEAHCNLAAVLQQRGAFDAALIALRRGDALGRARPSWSYPSQLWLAELEARIARLPKLDRIVAGEAPPSDPQELNDLAAIALARGDALLSLRLFEAVEGAAPATGPGRLDAARAAARVASAPAELAVPTAEVRARAHRFGVRRLRGLFGELEAAVAADTNLAGVRRELEAWLLVSDFAPLREAAGGSLDPERLAWVALFDEVRALRAALADR